MCSQWLTADEAAHRLGVSKPTLYAYVSRGLVDSEPGPGPSRARRYPAQGIERLRATRATPPAERAAGAAMSWGPPILDSALSLIESGRLYYRGRDAIELSRSSRLEDVAQLLWSAPDPITVPATSGEGPDLLPDDPVGALMERVLSRSRGGFSGARTPHAQNVRHATALLGDAFASVGAHGDGPLAQRLARGLGTTRADAVSATLVVCADHELNVSAFTARCVASAESSMDHAILGALCAFSGARHGAASIRVRRLVDDARRDGPQIAVRRAIAEYGAVPGFGHPLYPQGDPRALELIDRAGDAIDPATTELVRLCGRELGSTPDLDLGLVILADALGLPAAAASTMFALGRLVGWVAHIFETWDSGAFLRPRARYVGPAPDLQSPR